MPNRYLSVLLAGMISLGTANAVTAAPVNVTFGFAGQAIDGSEEIDGRVLDFIGAPSGLDEAFALQGPDRVTDMIFVEFGGMATVNGGTGLIGEPGAAELAEADSDLPDILPYFTSVSFARGDNSFLKSFSRGEDIRAHDGSWVDNGVFYDGQSGPLDVAGASAFFGFRIEVFLSEPLTPPSEACGGENCGPVDPTRAGVFYGYMMASRGSLIVDSIFYESQSDTSIIAGELGAVPLPAGGLLLAAGLGAFAWAGRRKV